MNVGLIHYGLDRQAGGIGRYTTELSSALAGQGITTQHFWAGKRPLNYQGLSLPGAYLLPGLLTIGQGQIARLARRQRLDIVHDPTGTIPLLLTRSTRVATIHDVIPYIYPETSTRLDWLIYRLWLPAAVRRLDAIITDSRQSKRDILRFLPVKEEDVFVVPLAANDAFKILPDSAVVAGLDKYRIQRPYILYVGSLESRKNLSRLLEAFSALRQQSGRWKLVIVGARKWKYAPIFETVRRLGLEPFVQFTDYIEEQDLPALYNGADLFVFPSLYEGFGLPVLEAMACGTPVVTSNVSSLPEVAGDAAIMVDPYNVEEIENAMGRVLDDEALAEELRSRGLARAGKFSWERTAVETIAVYKKVLKA